MDLYIKKTFKRDVKLLHHLPTLVLKLYTRIHTLVKERTIDAKHYFQYAPVFFRQFVFQ